MAKLVAGDRTEVWRECQSRLNTLSGSTALLKSEWQTLVDAADDFVDNNASVYNLTIPLGVRTKATSQEKALALMLVIAKRFIKGV